MMISNSDHRMVGGVIVVMTSGIDVGSTTCCRCGKVGLGVAGLTASVMIVMVHCDGAM